jgi:hypothetical protein
MTRFRKELIQKPGFESCNLNTKSQLKRLNTILYYEADQKASLLDQSYSVVTDLAKFLGQSTLWPLRTAMWYDNSCIGMILRMPEKHLITCLRKHYPFVQIMQQKHSQENQNKISITCKYAIDRMIVTAS